MEINVMSAPRHLETRLTVGALLLLKGKTRLDISCTTRSQARGRRVEERCIRADAAQVGTV